ncbi:MAG: LON peptidase substrate-binding domain-containing protein, partial [Clostridia bacterium]|nr:LON peptidase substrate-binding domain-containing protein [Clostridia bacterium]
MSQYIEKTEKLALPLIALRDTVAFPGALLNFELTDESDIRAAKAAAATDGLVFLVAEMPRHLAEELIDLIFHDEELGDDPADAPAPKLYPVGTVVRIKQMVQTPDKQFRVIFEGCTRATLLEADFGGDFATAEVMSKTVMLGDVNELRARAYLHTLLESLRGLSRYLPSGSEEMLQAAAIIRDPGQLADFIGANVLIKMEDKQETLECYEPFARADLVLSLIETEGELLKCSSDIQRKVHARMARNQKEFYLREQIRVIQDELGDGAAAETERYERRILALHLPEEAEQKLLKENDRLAKTPFGSSEAGVITT